MVKVWSDKISQKKLTRAIEHTIEYYKKHLYLIEVDYNEDVLELPIAPVEHRGRLYSIFKKTENILHRFKLSKLAIALDGALEPFLPSPQKVYLLSHFTQYHGEKFIMNTFIVLLGRVPSNSEFSHYKEQLFGGTQSKAQIVANIRFTDEGISRNIVILGIKKRYLIFKLFQTPFIGYFLKLIIAFARLPTLITRYNQLEALSFSQKEEIEAEIRRNLIKLNFELDSKLLHVKQELDRNFSEKEQSFEQIILDLRKDFQSLENSIDQDKRDIVYKLNSLRYKITTLKTTKIESVKQARAVPSSGMYDDFYLAFEDYFRGDRKSIKARQEYYLAWVRESMEHNDDRLLDLGCGRGEWLELLKENNLQGVGVDLNSTMVSYAKKYGLEVYCQDAVDYMSMLEDESVSVVTGFHIVEHLGFDLLMQLLDEVFRVLKRNGLVIFETPNPENIFVGTCSFYTDLTHVNPIPPVALEFIVQNRGFTNTSIHRLHPLKEPQFLNGKGYEDINNLIYASTKAQDYSIIGYKL